MCFPPQRRIAIIRFVDDLAVIVTLKYLRVRTVRSWLEKWLTLADEKNWRSLSNAALVLPVGFADELAVVVIAKHPRVRAV